MSLEMLRQRGAHGTISGTMPGARKPLQQQEIAIPRRQPFDKRLSALTSGDNHEPFPMRVGSLILVHLPDHHPRQHGRTARSRGPLICLPHPLLLAPLPPVLPRCSASTSRGEFSREGSQCPLLLLLLSASLRPAPAGRISDRRRNN